MRRITVTIEETLVEMVEADVAAGRAPSVSAWVAAAIRAKAHARAELIADLEALERQDPVAPEVIHSVAATLGLSKDAVERAVRRPRIGRAARRAG